MKKDCLNCGNAFFKKRNTSIKEWSTYKYCGLACYHKYMVGKSHGHKTCSPLHFVNSKRCILKGEQHPNWIKDRSKVKTGDRNLNDPLQKQWRRDIKNRDNWKCKISTEDCQGKLEAHHILPWSKFPELRYQINNGITLCHFHHPRKQKEVEALSPYFQKLVAEV